MMTFRIFLTCILFSASSYASAQMAAIFAQTTTCFRSNASLKEQSENLLEQGRALIQHAPQLSTSNSLEETKKCSQSDNVKEGRLLVKKSALLGNPKSILLLCFSSGDKATSSIVWSEGLAWCRLVGWLNQAEATPAERDEAEAMSKELGISLNPDQKTEIDKRENILREEIFYPKRRECWK